MEAMLLQAKNLTAGDTLTEKQVELLFESSIQLLSYFNRSISNARLSEDDESFAELLACLRGAFGRSGREEKTARLLLEGVQKENFLSTLVSSFKILCNNFKHSLVSSSEDISPNVVRILLRLAQVFNNISTLNYSTLRNDQIESICLPLFDETILS